jgi:2-aminoethylphosphonate-pyruvate transaminase
MILLNPGPVTLSARVRASLLGPDLCHRESEFFDLQDELRRGLLAVYGFDPRLWSAVLLTGSGTAAVESMLTSLVPESGSVLIAENGVYGERMAQICARFRIPHERLPGDWLEALDLEKLERRLSAGSAGTRFTHLAVVHHETTSGRLNPLKPVGELCRAHGVGLIVDAVSSFGAEEIDIADESLVALAATANKCLHGVPGISFVLTRRSCLAKAANRSYYLDLARLARLQDERNTPFTPAVQACYALAEGLREFTEQGGWSARRARYAARAEQIRSGLAALGITSALPKEESSVVLRAYHLPVGVDYQALHDALKSAGFVIYAGQGALSVSIFRIANMGEISAGDLERLLQCLARFRRSPPSAVLRT